MAAGDVQILRNHDETLVRILRLAAPQNVRLAFGNVAQRMNRAFRLRAQGQAGEIGRRQVFPRHFNLRVAHRKAIAGRQLLLLRDLFVADIQRRRVFAALDVQHAVRDGKAHGVMRQRRLFQKKIIGVARPLAEAGNDERAAEKRIAARPLPRFRDFQNRQRHVLPLAHAFVKKLNVADFDFIAVAGQFHVRLIFDFLIVDFHRQRHDGVQLAEIIFAVFKTEARGRADIFHAGQRNVLRVFQAGNDGILLRKKDRWIMIDFFHRVRPPQNVIAGFDKAIARGQFARVGKLARHEKLKAFDLLFIAGDDIIFVLQKLILAGNRHALVFALKNLSRRVAVFGNLINIKISVLHRQPEMLVRDALHVIIRRHFVAADDVFLLMIQAFQFHARAFRPNLDESPDNQGVIRHALFQAHRKLRGFQFQRRQQVDNQPFLMVARVKFGVAFDKLLIFIVEGANQILNCRMSFADFRAEFHAEEQVEFVRQAVKDGIPRFVFLSLHDSHRPLLQQAIFDRFFPKD